MSIWISILLAFLPKILEWILSLIKDNKKLSGKQLEKMNQVTFYAAQIAELAPKAGCTVGGVPPPVSGEVGDDEWPWEGLMVSGPIFGGWIEKFIMDYIRKNGKELGLRVLKTVIIPSLKERAVVSLNKWDNYGVKQLERIADDPEFLALLENVG